MAVVSNLRTHDLIILNCYNDHILILCPSWHFVVAGSTVIEMKGCFSNNVACDQNECIDHSVEQRNNLNFCCCKGFQCNSQHKWIPTTTVPTEIEGKIPWRIYDDRFSNYCICSATKEHTGQCGYNRHCSSNWNCYFINSNWRCLHTEAKEAFTV